MADHFTSRHLVNGVARILILTMALLLVCQAIPDTGYDHGRIIVLNVNAGEDVTIICDLDLDGNITPFWFMLNSTGEYQFIATNESLPAGHSVYDQPRRLFVANVSTHLNGALYKCGVILWNNQYMNSTRNYCISVTPGLMERLQVAILLWALLIALVIAVYFYLGTIISTFLIWLDALSMPNLEHALMNLGLIMIGITIIWINYPLEFGVVDVNLSISDIVGQTSIVVTNSSNTFEWNDCGFKIYIPSGSLPDNVDYCILRVFVSISGQYQFPKNHELVSAIYWIRSDPYCKFKHPLKIEMQHSAKSRYTHKLTFVRAATTQKARSFVFKKIKKRRGTFRANSFYGSIDVNHFSGYAIIAEGPVEHLYSASLFYLGRDIRSWEIHLVITWDIEPHNQNVKDYYKKKCDVHVVAGPFLSIEFEREEIALSIPMDGIAINGWKVIPLIRPALMQKQVDYFGPGKNIPCCQLRAKFSEQREDLIPELFHRLSLNGAKEPNNVITVEIDPTRIPKEKATCETGTIGFRNHQKRNLVGTTVSLDDKPSMTDLRSFILANGKTIDLVTEIGASYRKFGILLLEDVSKVDNIEQDNHYKAEAIVDRMLTDWLKGKGRWPVIWATLVEVLEKADLRVLAKDISAQYEIPGRD